MIFDNATDYSKRFHSFLYARTSKGLQPFGNAVYIFFNTLGYPKTTPCQLTLILRKAANSIMKLPAINDRVICTVVDHKKPIDFLPKVSTHRHNG